MVVIITAQQVAKTQTIFLKDLGTMSSKKVFKFGYKTFSLKKDIKARLKKKTKNCSRTKFTTEKDWNSFVHKLLAQLYSYMNLHFTLTPHSNRKEFNKYNFSSFH